jgi:selenocysteine-specific elongation factor
VAKRRFILGTAGHVDHGKTQLVSRLTGWDTDRLKEEKERGISIELGFAPLPLDPETMMGVVDVPGHERFVRQMVAGACGIDLAMLLVAADEGVMPQTKEHLEVLSSLHIASGVVVISKVDLATEEMLSIVKDEVAELVEGTFLEKAPIVGTSAKTGAGIDALKKTLLDLTRQIKERGRDGPFRLAVDRVFHIQGIGVVVTGSGYSGSVAVGDSLELLPSMKAVRVREIQSFGEKREQGYAGERLAIALQGAKLEEVSRGDMLVTPSTFVVSSVFDARIHVAEYAPFDLKHRERVRVHHGAVEVLGRVVLLEGDEIRSGENGLVQLRLESSIVGSEGDYFIIRKYSPTRVLGGGRIIEPRSSRHRRRDPSVLESLWLRESGGPTEKLFQTVEAAGLHGTREDTADVNAVTALQQESKVSVIDGVIFARSVLAALADRVSALATEYAATHPLRYGIDKEELRQKVRFPHPTPLFNSVLEELSRIRPLFVRDNRVRSDSETIELSKDLAQEISRLETLIKNAGLHFHRHSEIETGWKGRSVLQDALQFLKEDGRICRLGDDGYVHADAIDSCVEAIRGWFDSHDGLAVADLKDLFGITRKHAIPLLEYLDQARITVRDGNLRRKGRGLDGGMGKTPGGRD